MAKFGKWIGGGLGWVMGGPIGAVLGFALGSFFDSAEISYAATRKATTQPGDFLLCLILLSAAIMKADGRLMKSELNYIRTFFSKQFGRDKLGEIMKVLQKVIKQDIPVEDICMQISRYMQYAERLQLLHYLFGIAKADGKVSREESELIEKIARILGIRNTDYSSIREMFSVHDVSAYKILEIDESATDEEVKNAFRKMARKYHPDRVSHLGEDVKKAATEKFQELQSAYELIKKERGMQ